jgi:hypothetical protein
VPQHVILLLPRAELDLCPLKLPPSTPEEMPELVENMITQALDDVASPLVTDFVTLRDPGEVLAFALRRDRLNELIQQFAAAKLKLAHATFGGLGAIQLLDQAAKRPTQTSVIVTTTDHDTDLAVIEDGVPTLFRTIPRAAGDEAVPQQLADEIHRTLTIVGHPDDDAARVYLIGTLEEHEVGAKTLSEGLGLSVSLVNPFEQLDCGRATQPDDTSRFANLVGTACAWNAGEITIDLLAPRRPPVKPSPVRRFGIWGAVAATVLGVCGFMIWDEQATRAEQIRGQQEKLMRLAEQASKSLELQDTVAAINAWRKTDISWLDELLELSQKLPPADQAVVRRITMTTDSQDRGVITLPVQVSHPEILKQLEEAVRDARHSITSQRVTDTSDNANPSWQFTTTIVFQAEPVQQLTKSGDTNTETRPQIASAAAEGSDR